MCNRNQMIKISALKCLYWTSILFLCYTPICNADLSCPDGTLCKDGKQCCSVYPDKFECCEIWKFLLAEIEVAGREHFVGLPSEFGRLHHTKQCSRFTCTGTCCQDHCCEHLNAECCGKPHQCCQVGYKCCGRGQWCCPWKDACSSAYGYCISSVMSLKPSSMLLNFIIFMFLAFVNISVL
ncbi:progranulin-like [Argiope bruennichi]|uniref:progranulin-like n=1 Tax=Argiope bruennichi TaxID=94029 RepID=UPI002494DF93|nr:progranulin-like [Argiope bruennichi]